VDDLASIKAMHNEQKRWRLLSLLTFIAVLIVSSFVFIVLPRDVSGLFVQVLMILSMLSIIGLVFLDRVSFQLNKKFFKQNVIHEYLFKHSKPEDIHKDADIVVELIKDRRAASQEKKKT
jgi:hypothetical protein